MSSSEESEDVPLAKMGKRVNAPRVLVDDDEDYESSSEHDGTEGRGSEASTRSMESSDDEAESSDESAAGNDSDEAFESNESPSEKSSVKGETAAEIKIMVTATKSGDEGDEGESSDDDAPLSQLKSQTPKDPKEAKTAVPKIKAAKKKVTKKALKVKRSAKVEKPEKKAKKKPSAKKMMKSIEVISAINGGTTSNFVSSSSELYSKSEKGKLIQYLLCRWWYALTWPDPSLLPAKPPRNTDSLDGFPGVYVYTRGDSVGKLLDLRDKSKAPNFANFAHKEAAELKELLLTAIERQKEDLVAAEGPGTTTEKQLSELASWARKVSTDKADREAAKILKAARLTLPEIFIAKKEES